jgi:hypothetical protein
LRRSGAPTSRRRRRRPRPSNRPGAGVAGAVRETIEITGDLGSHALEALTLEVKRAAALCGLDVTEVRVETVEAKRSR